MDSEMKELPEVARGLGVTVDQCRYWLNLLGITIGHRGRVRVVAPDVAEMLAKVAELVKDGVSPKDAVTAVKSAPTDATLLPVTGSPVGGMAVFKGQLEGIKDALLMLAKQNDSLHAEVAELRNDNKALRDQMALLMPPKQDEKLFEVLNRSPEPVKVWSPVTKADPLEGAGLLARAWAHLVHPEKLRRHTEN